MGDLSGEVREGWSGEGILRMLGNGEGGLAEGWARAVFGGVWGALKFSDDGKAKAPMRKSHRGFRIDGDSEGGVGPWELV